MITSKASAESPPWTARPSTLTRGVLEAVLERRDVEAAPVDHQLLQAPLRCSGLPPRAGRWAPADPVEALVQMGDRGGVEQRPHRFDHDTHVGTLPAWTGRGLWRGHGTRTILPRGWRCSRWVNASRTRSRG